MFNTIVAGYATPSPALAVQGDYRVEVLTTRAELECIRHCWSRLVSHPNADLDHYLAVLEGNPNIICPYVLLVKHHGQPHTLAVGRLERLSFECNFGYRQLYSPIVRAITLIYGGISPDLPAQICELLLRNLFDALHRERATLICLNHLRLDSELYRLALSIPKRLSRDQLIFPSKHWRMLVPDSIESFYKGRKKEHRYRLRRMAKLLDKQFPGGVRYDIHSGLQSLPTVFRDADFVSRKTYQRGLNAGFIDNAETRQVLTVQASQNSLRSYFLHINNAPAAYWIGREYGKTFFLNFTGYDPAYRHLEIGTTLFIRMLDDLCGNKTVRLLDFGFGDAPYKSRFCDEWWQEGTVHIYSQNLRGYSLNLARFLTAGSHKLSADLLARFKLLQRAKRLWRNRLVATESQSAQSE